MMPKANGPKWWHQFEKRNNELRTAVLAKTRPLGIKKVGINLEKRTSRIRKRQKTATWVRIFAQRKFGLTIEACTKGVTKGFGEGKPVRNDPRIHTWVCDQRKRNGLGKSCESEIAEKKFLNLRTRKRLWRSPKQTTRRQQRSKNSREKCCRVPTCQLQEKSEHLSDNATTTTVNGTNPEHRESPADGLTIRKEDTRDSSVSIELPELWSKQPDRTVID